VRCKLWHQLKDVDASIKKQKRITPSERRAKLDAERGYKCKLCGLNFQEGQIVHIEVSQHSELARISAQESAQQQQQQQQQQEQKSQNSGISTRSVPAFGYELSRKMACRLSELLRDSYFPLTKFSRAVLVEESSLLEARTVAEKLREIETVELKKSVSGELSCCFFCFQIVEENTKSEKLCATIGKRLGVSVLRKEEIEAEEEELEEEKRKQAEVSSNAAPSSTKAMEKLSVLRSSMENLRISVSSYLEDLEENSPSQRPSSSSKSDLEVLPASKMIKDTEGGFGLDPWQSKHFKRGTCQWRIFVMVHYIADLKLPSSHALNGSIGCIAYSMGQSKITMPFKNVQEGGEYADNPLVWVKQCRMHYLCGRMQDVKSLFREKTIEMQLFFSPPPDPTSSSYIEHAAESMGFRTKEKVKTVPGRVSEAKKEAAKAKDPRKLGAPRLESTFSISLDHLNYHNTHGCHEGSEKFDYLVPISLASLGPAVLRMSIAIVKDEIFPWQLSEVPSFLKEKNVFWPPADYCDGNPLPLPWVAMLMTSDKEPEKEEEEEDKPPAKMEEHDLEILLHHYDHNKTGKLGPNEIAMILADANNPLKINPEVHAVLMKYDDNGDGKFDEKELTVLVQEVKETNDEENSSDDDSAGGDQVKLDKVNIYLFSLLFTLLLMIVCLCTLSTHLIAPFLTHIFSFI